MKSWLCPTHAGAAGMPCGARANACAADGPETDTDIGTDTGTGTRGGTQWR